jgi:eukaryotic-like serine/threonine-protein kinase
MKPERWQQLDKLFHSALERAPEERAAFLDQACPGDEELRKEVEALVAANAQAGSFIEKPALEAEARSLADEQRDAEAESMVGDTISHYRIISPLGSGGMGEVYLAQDTVLSRQVALKLLPEYFTRDQDRLRRFQQEARAASALNHPNIITIFEIGEFADRHFMVTEFIDGTTLRQHFFGEGRHTSGELLRLREVLDIAIQTADALAAAHEAGIVHRDIKPENIMVRRRDSYVKVLDFGLAKLTEGAVDTEAPTRAKVRTSAGVVMGTASYMSPEQARGEQLDVRTDIWSLGVVLYELVAGCGPFERSTPSEVIALILEREPPPLARYVREVPPELERIVSKALTKDREVRYQTAKDLLVDLRRLRQRLEVEAEIERTSQPREKSSEVKAPATDSEQKAAATARAAIVETGDASVAQSASLVKGIKLHRSGAVIALAAFVAVTAVAVYFAYSRYWAEGGRANIDSKTGIRSIAVLPLANTSQDPEMEYLSDGISESLINSLSQLPDVKVIASSSSSKYKGKNADPQVVANALGVEAILTGKVLQRGDDLLISVELMDARDKTQVWGDQYNRKATDLSAVQSEIAREIVERLRLRLTAGERQHLAKRETVNPQAYELELKGRFHQTRGGVENQKKAVEYFQQAIAVDPAYALAYAELSVSYSNLVRSSILDPKEFTPKAEAAVRTALALDESLAEAHRALAILELDAWSWAAAEREFKRAIELNPNLARAYGRYSLYLSIMRRHDEAIAAAKRARELDPLSPQINWVVASRLEFARRYDEAIEAAKKAFELDRDFHGLHVIIGHAYAAKGQYPEAIAAYQEAIKRGRDSPVSQISLGVAFAKVGEREKARVILKRLEAKKVDVSPGALVVLYVALGDREQAFAALERAYVAHDSNLQFLGVNPGLDPLRSDPRFVALMRRIGLTP